MRIYLDHNATSPMSAEVRERFLELLDEDLGNPSSTHASGRRARAVIDDSRAEIAAALCVPEESVLFTACGSESNNMALRGALEAPGGERGLATTVIEHSSVLEPARDLEQRGFPVSWIPVDERGALNLGSVQHVIESSGCRLLSTMAANNEVGSLAPLDEISELLGKAPSGRPLWHVDGVQALGRVPLRLSDWGVDLASFSAHKVGGPLGVGILFRKPGVELRPLALGGGQESNARAGTENAAAIAAAALAIRLACSKQESNAVRLGELSTMLWEGLQEVAARVRLLGPDLDSPRLPNTLNVLFENIDGRTLVARLDLEGVEASLGSACSSGAIEPSHVLLAMGFDAEEARAGLRLSLGACTSRADIHSAVDTMGKVLNELR